MKKITIMFTSFLLITSTNALNIKQKKMIKYEKEQLEKNTSLKAFKRDCTYLPKIELGNEFIFHFRSKRRSPSGYCASILGKIGYLCKSDPDILKHVKDNFKTLKCVANKEETKKVTFKKEGTTIIATISTKSSNVDAQGQEFIENNL